MSTSYCTIALLGKRIPVVMSNETTPEPAFSVVFAQTTIWADRLSVHAGEVFDVLVYYYDSIRDGWYPLPGARVKVGGSALITDTSGRLSTSIDTAGVYTLRASKRYYNSSEFEIEVLPALSEEQMEVEAVLGTPTQNPNILYIDESENSNGVHPPNRASGDKTPAGEPAGETSAGLPSEGYEAVGSVCALLIALLLVGRRKR